MLHTVFLSYVVAASVISHDCRSTIGVLSISVQKNICLRKEYIHESGCQLGHLIHSRASKGTKPIKHTVLTEIDVTCALPFSLLIHKNVDFCSSFQALL